VEQTFDRATRTSENSSATRRVNRLRMPASPAGIRVSWQSQVWALNCLAPAGLSAAATIPPVAKSPSPAITCVTQRRVRIRSPQSMSREPRQRRYVRAHGVCRGKRIIMRAQPRSGDTPLASSRASSCRTIVAPRCGSRAETDARKPRLMPGSHRFRRSAAERGLSDDRAGREQGSRLKPTGRWNVNARTTG
jgi:hypothetical protein